ncbi:LysE family translocator [Yoonia sp. 208BN28-4]|uniref:LysE family translocator n=1 Tax=Yoonia sp. 208BN28-4 TaxID=3126505 RepID=UPI0030AF3018
MAEFYPLLAFVFLGLFSPGPNVILLTASGARFGFVRTVPHVLGVAVGVGIIAGVTALGVGALLKAAPMLTLVLKVIACAWILRMAWNLWHADPAKQKNDRDRPFTFIEAVLFQWVNPKIWAVALSAMAFVEGWSVLAQTGSLAGAFSGVNLFVCLFWTAAGAALSYLLTNPAAWRVFMRTMAVALAAFSVLVFL